MFSSWIWKSIEVSILLCVAFFCCNVTLRYVYIYILFHWVLKISWLIHTGSTRWKECLQISYWKVRMKNHHFVLWLRSWKPSLPCCTLFSSTQILGLAVVIVWAWRILPNLFQRWTWIQSSRCYFQIATKVQNLTWGCMKISLYFFLLMWGRDLVSLYIQLFAYLLP